jgi:hypothetical protein
MLYCIHLPPLTNHVPHAGNITKTKTIYYITKCISQNLQRTLPSAVKKTRDTNNNKMQRTPSSEEESVCFSVASVSGFNIGFQHYLFHHLRFELDTSEHKFRCIAQLTCSLSVYNSFIFVLSLRFVFCLN